MCNVMWVTVSMCTVGDSVPAHRVKLCGWQCPCVMCKVMGTTVSLCTVYSYVGDSVHMYCVKWGDSVHV